MKTSAAAAVVAGGGETAPLNETPPQLESFDDLIRQGGQRTISSNDQNLQALNSTFNAGQNTEATNNHGNSLDVPSLSSSNNSTLVRRRSSGGDTVVPNNTNGKLDSDDAIVQASEQDAAAEDSDLDDSIVTLRPAHHQQNFDVATQSPSSFAATAAAAEERERAESRWNGFHLWRAESYQRRISLRQQQNEQQRLRVQHEQRFPRVALKAICKHARNALTMCHSYAGTRFGGKISRIQLFTLTLVFAGLQVCSSLQLGYRTPYLLSIGLSQAKTTLIWISAPLSGLIIQPLIGTLTDLNTASTFKRRKYIAWSLTSLCAAMFALAFSMPIASALADVLHIGMADWDPVRKHARDAIQHTLIVAAFVVLDMSTNGVQAAAIALVLDVTPTSMHSRVNAWIAIMMRAGSVFGFAAGWLDLSSADFLAWLGGDQFRRYAIISILSVVACTTITFACVHESPAFQQQKQQQPQLSVTGMHDDEGGMTANEHSVSVAASMPLDMQQPVNALPPNTFQQHVRQAALHMWNAFRRLPRSVRRIFLVQLFANAAWFPFLVYTSEWVIEVWSAEQTAIGPNLFFNDGIGDGANEDVRNQRKLEHAERIGSYALLLCAIVSLGAAMVLPYLSLANYSDVKITPTSVSRAAADNDERQPLLPTSRRENDDDAARKQEQQRRRRPAWLLSMRTLWACALTVFFVQSSILTFFVEHSSRLTIALIASIGVPFAVQLWIPTALVMEAIREAEQGQSPYEFDGDWFAPERVRSRRSKKRAQYVTNTAVQQTQSATTDPSEATRRAHIASAVQDCGPLEGGSDGQRKVSGARSILSRGASVLGSTKMARNASTGSNAQLSRNATTSEAIDNDVVLTTDESVGATILGLHNVAVVIPQIIFAIMIAVFYRHPYSRSGDQDAYSINGVYESTNTNAGLGKDISVAWTFRWAGLAALCAALATRLVPLSQTERLLLRDRATLRQVAFADEQPPTQTMTASGRFDDEVSETSSENE